MTEEILSRHRRGETKNGIPNPSLEQMCSLVFKAASFITPNVQRRSFEHTGLTLAVDGGEDNKLSPELSDLFRRFGEDPVPRADFRPHFYSQEEISESRPSIAKIFRNLCIEGAKAKEEDFQREPVLQNPKKPQR
jgi:hypothetical protein